MFDGRSLVPLVPLVPWGRGVLKYETCLCDVAPEITTLCSIHTLLLFVLYFTRFRICISHNLADPALDQWCRVSTVQTVR